MELTEELGTEIIQRLSKYIDVPINLMNHLGKIVASTDERRVGQQHGGAEAVIKSGQPQIITLEDVNMYSNTKPGVNLPIFHREALAGVVGLTGEPDRVMQAAGMTQGSVEITLEQIYIQRQTFFQERQWNYWLQRLVQSTSWDEAGLKQEAAYSLGVNVHKMWQVGVIQTDHPYEAVEAIRIAFKNHDPLFVLPFQEDLVVACLPYIESVQAFDKLTEYVIGVGQQGYSLDGIRRSFHQAKESLEIAGQKGKPAYSQSLEMERLLHHIDSKTMDEISHTYEHSLRALEPFYYETLTTFFANNLRMNQTAHSLHIHRNTLMYRLDQLEKKTGLDPRSFKDAIILQSILLHM
ncbi:helix-turn-helix domain-containing protein [Halobacillus litoralis]|uniref:CdaR family transcriptional regulator n=1 Tax=Halobacillus litoralis TaxID=45668 RepID=UPI001CD7D5B5|nr:sugar diacid recognition domain-containing protein [Halobacillus litoralis]MCA0971377.1 helix-turn-helix domain-containing protein [Halobacillus litoralis]